MDDARTIEIEGHSTVYALLFLDDGKHLLSGSEDGMIRQWSIEHGTQVGEPIKGNERIRALSLSSDRKWILSGEFQVARLWDRRTWKEALRVQEHTLEVEAVDFSPDLTKFATGARDRRAFVWDISTGRRLLGPLVHDNSVVAIKFSPNGDHIATTTWDRDPLRIYNSYTGQLIRTISAKAHGLSSIAWSTDSQRIFASSLNTIRHIYLDTGTSISQWIISGDTKGAHGSLVIPSNNKFIASFVGSSLSLLDTLTGLCFGRVFEHPGQKLRTIAISSDNNYLATSGEGGIITLRNLSGIIPMPYLIQRPHNTNRGNMRVQLEALEAFRSALRAVELRFDELGGSTMQVNDRHQSQANSLHIPDGSYRIKSSVADLYLTCPQDPEDTVVVRQLDPSSEFQRWCVYHVQDGAYSIVGRRGNSDVTLSSTSRNELVCIPSSESTWNIDARGNTYVIGSSASAMAIHLTQRPQHVWAFLRDNSQNQRWALEPA